MVSFSPNLQEILWIFAPTFTTPTFENVLVLFVGAVMSPKDRTVSGMLRAAGFLATKQFTTYHRVFSQRKWNLLLLAFLLACLVIALIPPDQPVVCAVDDTTVRRWGKKVYGKGRHRDPVRSTRKQVVHCLGHKWVVIAVLVPMPFTDRLWALPILPLLYRPEGEEKAEGKRHCTCIDWARKGSAWLLRKFPTRHFILIGDGGYNSLVFALWCSIHQDRITLVSRFHKNAALYASPPSGKKGKRGPKPKKGKRLLSPQQEADDPRRRWTKAKVAWYHQSVKDVELIWKTALWYHPGHDPVRIRWVFVRYTNEKGKLEEECFFSTDPKMRPKQMVEHYVTRWNIETTFEEARAHLGLETLENYCENAVKRSVPALLGLFSIIAIWFRRKWQLAPPKLQTAPWYRKTEPTFSDALVAIRLDLLDHTFFSDPLLRAGLQLIPPPFRDFFIQRLVQVA
jgi:hypothetical protein